MAIRLYVGNLPKEPIERQALQEVFADVETVSTKVIKDRKTGKCRGFAFVTVANDDVANELIEKHNGESFMDNPLKIEKALPRSKNKSNGNKEKEKETRETPSNSNSGSSKRGGKKRDRGGSSSDSGSVQPDPRWADELSKLKEMLTAQTSNS
ncbi:RNA-binding protein [Spirulina sp. CS-785/01]|uniref:RNA recognition motif domain-containing protein n=1 Tax=Spirulina sp. CS-785/01 TaxID=3021716 RepID=UPI00233084BB|nr:RNA-binding protein [Spirulina sp. CS-785/01]MDB9315441.1 RNA-binding protein [Spirulina sp. CS-785/01]